MSIRRSVLIRRAKLYLMHHHIARPSVFYCESGVCNAISTRLQALKQGQVMIPRQLSKWCLDNFFSRPCIRELPHIHEIGARPPLHVGERRFQIRRHPFDDFGAPSLALLLLKDFMADIPIKQRLLGIDKHGRLDTRPLDSLLDRTNPRFVAFCRN